MAAVDSVRMTLVGNYLRNVCHEMGVAMMKTSYSSHLQRGPRLLVRRVRRRGRADRHGEFCPAQIGAMLFTVDWTIEELGPDALRAGRRVVHNDPYRGGCHLPEHLRDEAGLPRRRADRPSPPTSAHVTEIGGKAPGGFAADATDVYQEGLRLPPVKLMRRRRATTRTSGASCSRTTARRGSTWGDFHAMIGSLNVGERRMLRALLERYGDAEIERARRGPASTTPSGACAPRSRRSRTASTRSRT